MTWPWLVLSPSIDVRQAQRIAVFGLGRIGSAVGRLLLANPSYEIVGAVDHSAELVGRDLGEHLDGGHIGLTIRPPEYFDWKTTRCDAVIYGAVDDLRQAESHLTAAIEGGANVIAFTVGLAFPWQRFSDVAERLDAAARSAGVSVLGTGVNPGFINDVLLLGLASACSQVDSVACTRINDLADQSSGQLDQRGIGESPQAFDQRLASGVVKVHTGADETVGILARSFGWAISRLDRRVRPVLARSAIQLADRTIDVGQVAGLDHTVTAWDDGEARIRLRHLHLASPESQGRRPSDQLRIRGTPPISVTIRPEVQGRDATAAMAVNALGYIAAAPPGLLTVGYPGPVPSPLRTGPIVGVRS
jgi:2,4-diaminopentanoate dehydrogenase